MGKAEELEVEENAPRGQLCWLLGTTKPWSYEQNVKPPLKHRIWAWAEAVTFPSAPRWTEKVKVNGDAKGGQKELTANGFLARSTAQRASAF